jgi:hypothetical protein
LVQFSLFLHHWCHYTFLVGWFEMKFCETIHSFFGNNDVSYCQHYYITTIYYLPSPTPLTTAFSLHESTQYKIAEKTLIWTIHTIHIYNPSIHHPYTTYTPPYSANSTQPLFAFFLILEMQYWWKNLMVTLSPPSLYFYSYLESNLILFCFILLLFPILPPR